MIPSNLTCAQGGRMVRSLGAIQFVSAAQIRLNPSFRISDFAGKPALEEANRLAMESRWVPPIFSHDI